LPGDLLTDLLTDLPAEPLADLPGNLLGDLPGNRWAAPLAEDEVGLLGIVTSVSEPAGGSAPGHGCLTRGSRKAVSCRYRFPLYSFP